MKPITKLILLALTSSQAHGVVILHTTFQKNGGKIDPPNHANVDLGYSAHRNLSKQDQFKSVIQFNDVGCTGTLIGNDSSGNSYFLTAAHCFGFENGFSESAGFSFTDWNGTKHENDTATVTYYVPPNWDSNTLSGDMQILKVSSTFNISGWTKPTLYTGTQEVGKKVTWVGYGLRGIGGLPAGTTGTTAENKALYGSGRAAGTNVVDTIIGGNSFEFDFDAPATAVDEFEGHFGGGDSGGSIWMQENGKWVISGIVSSAGIEEYGEFNTATRASSYKSWVSSVYADAQFSTVPEPSSTLLIGLSGMALLMRRRK